MQTTSANLLLLFDRMSIDNRTFGQKSADFIASLVGSWGFIICQAIILMIWIGLNVTVYIQHWDSYPFILLNLVLSFQAAFTAPIIMISQNRQEALQHRQDRYMLHLLEATQAQMKFIIDENKTPMPPNEP